MQFLSRGVVTSVIAVLISVFGISGKAGEFLTDPSVVDNLLIIVGAIMAIVAGAMQGVKPATPAAAPVPASPEYPGWLWDPAKGWVPDPSYKPELSDE